MNQNLILTIVISVIALSAFITIFLHNYFSISRYRAYAKELEERLIKCRKSYIELAEKKSKFEHSELNTKHKIVAISVDIPKNDTSFNRWNSFRKKAEKYVIKTGSKLILKVFVDD